MIKFRASISGNVTKKILILSALVLIVEVLSSLLPDSGKVKQK